MEKILKAYQAFFAMGNGLEKAEACADAFKRLVEAGVDPEAAIDVLQKIDGGKYSSALVVSTNVKQQPATLTPEQEAERSLAEATQQAVSRGKLLFDRLKDTGLTIKRRYLGTMENVTLGRDEIKAYIVQFTMGALAMDEKRAIEYLDPPEPTVDPPVVTPAPPVATPVEEERKCYSEPISKPKESLHDSITKYIKESPAWMKIVAVALVAFFLLLVFGSTILQVWEYLEGIKVLGYVIQGSILGLAASCLNYFKHEKVKNDLKRKYLGRLIYALMFLALLFFGSAAWRGFSPISKNVLDAVTPATQEEKQKETKVGENTENPTPDQTKEEDLLPLPKNLQAKSEPIVIVPPISTKPTIGGQMKEDSFYYAVALGSAGKLCYFLLSKESTTVDGKTVVKDNTSISEYNDVVQWVGSLNIQPRENILKTQREVLRKWGFDVDQNGKALVSPNVPQKDKEYLQKIIEHSNISF